MGWRYRSWAERRDIVRSVIAESGPPPIDAFDLSPAEEMHYRIRAERLVYRLARSSSNFRGYHKLAIARPFGLVVATSAFTLAIAGIAAFYLALHQQDRLPPYPLLAACATVMAAAIGWTVAGWISHRNTVRQNTNSILFSRFSQAPFGEALHRFHRQFGFNLREPITSSMLKQLRHSGRDEDQRAAASVNYILNYFESIASGVLHGDLDQQIVRDNVRGLICNYFDKCSGHVWSSNKANPKTYENLIRLRTHYREP